MNNEENVVKLKTSHLWNALWTVLLVVIGTGMMGIIDERITNHPKVIETFDMVKEQNKEITEIAKAIVRLETLLGKKLGSDN